MAEIAPNIAWQEKLEKHFCDVGEKAHSLSWLHKQSEARYSRLKNYTDLPVIILGVLNGATSIGSNSLFNDPKMASVGVGAIALLTAILSTVSSFFGWARRAEAHRIASLQYSKLYRTVCLQMSLPRHERMSPSDLLKFTKEAYDRMAETAPMIPPEVIAHYKRVFDNNPKYENITRPEESNGLEAITVYHTPGGAAATEVGFHPVPLPGGEHHRPLPVLTQHPAVQSAVRRQSVRPETDSQSPPTLIVDDVPPGH